MNIHEAVKLACTQDKCITLPWEAGSCKIKPTNDCGNCVVITKDGRRSKHGWQPTADDLVNEEWLVVD